MWGSRQEHLHLAYCAYAFLAYIFQHSGHNADGQTLDYQFCDDWVESTTAAVQNTWALLQLLRCCEARLKRLSPGAE